MTERARILPEYSCHVCGGEINTWDWRLTMVLGFDHPHCERCIAKEYDQTVDEIRASVKEFFGMVPCQGI